MKPFGHSVNKLRLSKFFLKALVTLSCVSVILGCKESFNRRDHYQYFETRFPENMKNRFTLFLFPDSTFIYEYNTGQGFLEKEIGQWSQTADNNITLWQGQQIVKEITAEYITGTTDSVVFNFDEKILKAFPSGTLNINDTVNLALKPRIVVRKQEFVPRFMPSESRDIYFIVGTKLKLAGSYYLFDQVGPVSTLNIKYNGLGEKTHKKGTSLLRLKKDKDVLKFVSGTGSISFSILHERSKRYNMRLVEKLDSLFKVDQKINAAIDSFERNGFKDQLYVNSQKKLISENCKVGKDIYLKFGLPTYDLAGEYGAYCFWLIVQHADDDVSFQENVLERYKIESLSENVGNRELAFLIDRINVNKGLPQVYGTQVFYDEDGFARFKQVASEKKLDSLRASLGLEEIDGYLNMMTLMHLPEGKKLKKPVKININF